MTTLNQKAPEIVQLEEQAIHGKPKCIILARKGSKRLKNKRKLLLNGKPLIMYNIDVAKESDLFDGIMVSTDDEDVLEMAYEAKVQLHKREKTLCGDTVQMRHVIRYLMSQFDYGNCCCLMGACNPFVTPDDLKEGLKLFRDKQANYVMSVKLVKPPVENARRLIKGCLEPIKDLGRSQTLEPRYVHDGGFIFFNPNIFMIEFDWGFYGSKNYPYITPHPSVDIDTMEDFQLASILINRWQGENNGG